MKKLILNLIAFTFITAAFTHCGNSSSSASNREENKENTQTYDELSIEIRKYEDKQSDCKSEDCTYVLLKVPQLKGGNPKAVDRINNFIDSRFHEALKSRLPEPMGNASIQDMAHGFIEGYELFILEFPDSERQWYLEIDGTKSELGEDYFTLYIDQKEYMGGAHPSKFVTLASFDLTSGTTINILDLYDKKQLERLAEERFRKIHKLKQDQDLNDAGFMFENGIFVLPENMALTNEGILFVYNSYEVAAYSEGETRFTIPYSELSPTA